MFTEDLDVFFSDFGEPTVWNSSTFSGIFDIPDELMGGIAIGSEPQLLVKSSAIVGMKDQDPIVFRGTTYYCKYAQKIGDGALSIIRLGVH